MLIKVLNIFKYLKINLLYKVYHKNKMISKPFLKFLLIATVVFPFQSMKADYLLVIGTYRQGPGNRPEVSGITSPSLYSLPMKDIETCRIAGEKITCLLYTSPSPRD